MADSQQGTVTVTISASAQAPAVTVTTGATAVEPIASSTQLSAPTQPTPLAPNSGATDAAPGGLDEAQFWQLVEETRRDAGNDTGRQSELLENRLTQLSPAAIVEFARIRHRLDQQAYTWELWAAATVIEDGCSDDCFRDFRGYIISLGRGPYEEALRDPDSLASVAQDAETGDWENADSRTRRILEPDERRLPAGRLRFVRTPAWHAVQRERRGRSRAPLPAACCTLPLTLASGGHARNSRRR
jgi:hypothetical protein